MRAKAKVQSEAIDYEIPARAELPDRTESVLRVIYLIFNEGTVDLPSERFQARPLP